MVNEEATVADLPIREEVKAATAEEELPPNLPDETTIIAPSPLTSSTPRVTYLAAEVTLPELAVTIQQSAVAWSDSLPKPVIPQMTTNSTLPAPPMFSMSTKQVEDLLAQGDTGRKELRAATRAYRDQIEDWNYRVSAEFLRPWGNQRERVIQAYDDWNGELKAWAENELTYALAHQKMTKAFERALEEHEDAMEAAEDAIEDQPEDTTQSLERAIERGEKSIKEHSERMDVHSTRMGMHSVRMQIHSGRMRVHSARMQMHSSRMQLHSARMKSHGIIMAALEAELREALVADGLLAEGTNDFQFEATSSTVTLNGKAIEPAALAQKYRDLLTKYGKGDFKGNPGKTFMIHIDGKSRNIGTHYERN